jgi:signal transduction histidine kinase
MIWFRDLRMMPKLIGSFILLAFLAAAVGTAGLVGLNTLDSEVNSISTVNVPNITYRFRTKADVADSVRYTRAAVLATTASQSKAYADKAAVTREQAKTDWQTLRSLPSLGEADRALAAQVDPLVRRWLSLDAQVGQLAVQNTAASHAEAGSISVGPEALLATSITDNLDKLVAVNERAVTAAESSSLSAFSAAKAELVAVIALAVILAIALGYVLSRSLEAEHRSHEQTVVERDRIRQILGTLPDGVMIYTADSRVASANHAAVALFGDHLVGKKRSDLDIGSRRLDGTPVPWEDLPSMHALEVGECSQGIQLLVRDIATGNDLAILTSSALLKDATGATIGIVSVLQDISAIRSLEQQRDRMLATVTHDLRNPLTSISGMSQLLQMRIERVEEPARERFAHTLKTIEAAARRMEAQISDLLDYTQAQSGHPLDLGLEPIDVVGLLRQVLVEYQRSTDRHTLELQAGEESIVTLVDPRRLERAIANLLVNAIKYSPQGGPIVVSVARSGGSEGPWLTIAVADTGLGIPSKDLPHLFEQYYRASNVAATIPGTGIGLTNVRHMVQSHGGSMSVDSTEGVGTTVTVRLPLLQTVDVRAGAV